MHGSSGFRRAMYNHNTRGRAILAFVGHDDAVCFTRVSEGGGSDQSEEHVLAVSMCDSVCQARNTCSLRFSCFPLLPVNCTWSPHRIDVSHCIVKRTQPYCQPASSLQPPQRQHGYGRRQSPPPPAALPRCRGREPTRGEAARAAHLRRPRILPVRFRMGA